MLCEAFEEMTCWVSKEINKMFACCGNYWGLARERCYVSLSTTGHVEKTQTVGRTASMRIEWYTGTASHSTRRESPLEAGLVVNVMVQAASKQTEILCRAY
jgi:hypothetical protein